MAHVAKDQGLQINLSCADPEAEKAAGGVGVVWRAPGTVEHTPPANSDTTCAEAAQQGRARRVLLASAAGTAIRVFIICAWPTSHAIALNRRRSEELLDAILDEAAPYTDAPVLLAGDLNAELSDYGPMRDAMHRGWLDLGANVPTPSSSSGATTSLPTRQPCPWSLELKSIAQRSSRYTGL